MVRTAVSLLFAGLVAWLGYYTHRADFVSYLLPYTAVWVLYLGVLYVTKQINSTSTTATLPPWAKNLGDHRWQLGLGIALRFLLLFSLPNLSEDCYRFLWDGRLWAQGIHPFANTPEAIMEMQVPLRGITEQLYGLLNSSHYHTVYPPVCQFVFWLVACCAPENVPLAVFLLKTVLFGGELLMLGLFYKRAPNRIAYWALNPLVIIEIVGNCHFEGLMAALMLLAVQYLQRSRPNTAGLMWALAVATKLLPILFIPLIWVWAGWKKSLWFTFSAAIVTVLLFIPLADLAVLKNMQTSLHLYFSQFEFNASLYYVAKFGGNLFAQWDTGSRVNPILALCTVCFVLILAVYRVLRPARTEQTMQEMLLWAASVYLLNASTVHPWYVLIPLAMSYGTRWTFPVVWSGVVALSYSHYIGGGLQERYGLIGLEYGLLLGYFLWEWRYLRGVKR